MFTGIIETEGVLIEVESQGTNKTYTIRTELASELKVDQSVAHDGVCLTVIDVTQHEYRVTAIAETLEKTRLNNWKIGSVLNLERCMKSDGRFDGHMVYGHIDTVCELTSVESQDGSYVLTFSYPQQVGTIIEKGSVCLNGISLTCFNVLNGTFQVAVIPYTWGHTNLRTLNEGDSVNLEFDIIGKYIQQLIK